MPRCRRCALRTSADAPVCGACLRDPSPIDQTIAVADYAYPFDALIARFKFNDALDLAQAMAQRLADVVDAAGDERPHWVLPAPLSKERLRERGYNQAWELARRVAARLACKADATLLLRAKNTPHQLALPREQRAANVRGAFLVEPRRTHELRGCDVAVVDDVMTTGATGAEIARTLKQAGAQRVRLWVIARTPAQ